MNREHLISKQKIQVLILAGIFMLQFTSDESNFDTLLIKKMEIYKERFPMEVVYIQTDKNIYLPGEDLSFKAYIKDYYSTNPGLISQNLQLLLIDPEGEEVLNITFQIGNSQSARYFFLNENLKEGKVYAYWVYGFNEEWKS